VTKWVYCHDPQRWYTVTIDYSSLPEADIARYPVRDLLTVRTGTKAENTGLANSILEFIVQLDKRGPLTTDEAHFVVQSALFRQHDLITTASVLPVDLSGDSTIIALALNCLVHMHNLCRAFGQKLYWGSAVKADPIQGSDGPFTLMEADHTEWCGIIVPTVTIYRHSEKPDAMPDDTVKAGWELDADPGTALHHIVQHLFQLLDKQDPQHWPLVM
jgi:hypothetical protein